MPWLCRWFSKNCRESGEMSKTWFKVQIPEGTYHLFNVYCIEDAQSIRWWRVRYCELGKLLLLLVVVPTHGWKISKRTNCWQIFRYEVMGKEEPATISPSLWLTVLLNFEVKQIDRGILHLEITQGKPAISPNNFLGFLQDLRMEALKLSIQKNDFRILVPLCSSRAPYCPW